MLTNGMPRSDPLRTLATSLIIGQVPSLSKASEFAHAARPWPKLGKPHSCTEARQWQETRKAAADGAGVHGG
jgi:hypothetical protein